MARHIYDSKLQKTRKTTYNSWIKSLVSEIDLGQKITLANGSTKIVYLNTSDDILNFYRRLRAGGHDWLNRWTATKFANHRDNLTTHYFAGAENSKQPRTLIMIDVDCKSRGTAAGAAEYLNFLTTDQCQAKYGISFPDLYCEASTSGTGGHGFFVLEKQEFGAAQINQVLLGRLTRILNHILVSEQFDAEFIEIKGTLAVLSWGKSKFQLESLTHGQFGKLPRDGEKRFAELEKTTIVTMTDLLRIPANLPSVLLADVNMQTSGTSDLTMGLRGSISGKIFNEYKLAGLQQGGVYHSLASQLMSSHPIQKAGRHIVSVDDVAIFLMLGEFLSENINSSGTMPTLRWRRLWESVKAEGDITRCWEPHRFTAIRNWLSELDLINWQDASFRVKSYDHQGKKIDGVACKWHFSVELMSAMVEEKKREILCSTSSGPEDSDLYFRPENDFKTINWTKSITRLAPEDTITPWEVLTIRHWNVDPDEITRLLQAA